jgi:hypothetical protein
MSKIKTLAFLGAILIIGMLIFSFIVLFLAPVSHSSDIVSAQTPNSCSVLSTSSINSNYQIVQMYCSAPYGDTEICYVAIPIATWNVALSCTKGISP